MSSAMIPRLAGVAAALVLALGSAAGCGKITTPPPSNSSAASPSAINPASSGTTGGNSAGTAATVTVKTASTSLGTILVNAAGMTLYRYTADKKDTSNCTWGGCTTLWPPLAAQGTPKAGAGVTASLLTTMTGPTGQKQVAYDGWPLYTYAGDSKPGQTTGEKVKDSHGTWYVVYSAASKNPAPSA